MSKQKKIVSLSQIEVLVEFLEKHRDLAVGRLRSKEARALSQRLWTECADLLNREGDGISRSPKEWQKWYTDFKSRIRGRERQIKLNISGTGGGTGVPVLPLSAVEERLCLLLEGGRSVAGRDGTPPQQVRINPVHVIEEHVIEEHAIEDNSNLNYGDLFFEDFNPLIHQSEDRQSSPVPSTSRRHIPESELEDNESLHQRLRRSRRPTNRLREEVPHSENNSALEDSRQMLIRMETLRCESTKLLADSVRQLAASLVQNAEATKELAQSMREMKKHCCCRQSDDVPLRYDSD